MDRVYIVYKLGIEMSFIYGVFSSKEELERGLETLAHSDIHIEDAKRREKEMRDWYERVHLPWIEGQNREPNKPKELDMDLIEISKYLFGVYEIEVDKVIIDPYYLGFYEDVE